MIEDYCLDLKRGGFTEMWILETLKSATKGYVKLVRKEQEGNARIDRSGASGKDARRAKKLSKSSWFKSTQKDSQEAEHHLLRLK